MDSEEEVITASVGIPLLMAGIRMMRQNRRRRRIWVRPWVLRREQTGLVKCLLKSLENISAASTRLAAASRLSAVLVTCITRRAAVSARISVERIFLTFFFQWHCHMSIHRGVHRVNVYQLRLA